MKRMANYDTYVLVTVLPPAIIIFTILLSSYCVWGISYLRFKIQKRRARQNVTTNIVIEYPGLQYMYIAMQVVFGNRLHARKTQDRVKVRLFGEEMSPAAIPLIIQLIALALGLSFAVFVTVLTVETGQVCNEKWDCFLFDYTSQVRPLRTEPIQNCSVYQSNSIVCFHFTIRLIDALSNSGGILALTVIGINFYLAFLLTLVRAQFCRVKGLCGCLLVSLIGCIILLSTLLWILPLVLDQNETLKLVRNWESFLIYYYTVVYIIAAATVLPFCVPRHLQGFGTCGSTARRYLGRDDESETPNEESSDEEESQPVQTRATSNRNGNHAYQTSYYGLHREHHSRERLNKPPSAVSQPAGDHEPQSDASQTSDTPIASGAKNIRDETNPLVTTAEPQHLTKRSSSKRASGSLRKNKAARKRREERGRRQGGHWTETKDRGSEEEWSTSEDDYRHRNNGNKTETSSEEEVEEHSPQGGAEGREGREGGREQESARIRAVLTGEGVENGAKGGDVSVRTHL